MFYYDTVTLRCLGVFSDPSAAPANSAGTELVPVSGKQDFIDGAWGYSKATLKDLARDKRYRVETGGISQFGETGFPLLTDRLTQNMISAADAFASATHTVTDWEGPSGWLTLDPESIHFIAVAIGTHVQASFSAQRAIGILIDAGTITTLEQIEGWQGWPTN